MHPRLTVNTIGLATTTLADDIAMLKRLGFAGMGLPVAKLQAAGWNKGIDSVRASGLQISTMLHPLWFTLHDRSAWESERAAIVQTLDAGHQLSAATLYGTTGPRGPLTWEEAAEAFVEAVAPVADYAESLGLPMLLEQTPPMFADYNFVFTLQDTVRLAEMAGVGLCLDLYHFWGESDLKATIQRAVPRTHLVQVSDYTIGDRSFPARSVPGDGVIPLERMLRWVFDAGYDGLIDFEMMGPRIDAEGPEAAFRRAGDYMTAMLQRLGE